MELKILILLTVFSVCEISTHQTEARIPSRSRASGVLTAISNERNKSELDSSNGVEETMYLSQISGGWVDSSSRMDVGMRRRHRRSFGYKTKCIPTETEKCRVFVVRGVWKNICIKYTEFMCTALD